MRDKRNRLQVGTVYVLGAGASYSATLTSGAVSPTTTPLDNQFCNRIANLDYVRPGWVGEAVRELDRNWKDHQAFDSFGLEAAIIRHLSHLKFFDSIDRRRRTRLAAPDYIDVLAHLITFVLRRCKESRGNMLRQFVSHVFPLRQRVTEAGSNRIITFNYDDLLDQHMLKRFSPQLVYFDKIMNSRDDGNRSTVRNTKPLLVKLHGSVNWRCSTEEFRRVIDPPLGSDEPYLIDRIWFAPSGSPSPEDDESPCIVPPMPEKPLTQVKLFRYLWTRACEYLHEAEELVICGYSLPETDDLAMSMFGNIKNDRLQHVTVIDPNPEILARWRSLLIRRGVRRAEWHYHSDFCEYVEALQ